MTSVQRVIWLSTFTLLVFCCPVSGATLLWDDSHDSDGDELSGTFSMFASALAGAGHSLIELKGPPGSVTPSSLSGFEPTF